VQLRLYPLALQALDVGGLRRRGLGGGREAQGRAHGGLELFLGQLAPLLASGF
jgi:hypothetical protein